MREFELFLLCDSPNMANQASALLKGELPKKWAAEFILRLGEPLLDGTIQEVEEWAVVESLNTGSHQRARLPEWISRCLEGSGRWHALDQGGWYRLLLLSTLRWIRASEGQKRSLAYLSGMYTRSDLKRAFLKACPERARRAGIEIEEIPAE
jgi:hypothetical protein